MEYSLTNWNDLQTVIDSLEMEKKEVVIDLGAGIGTVIFEAAKQAHEKGLTTKFYAIDIHFLMVLILWFRRLFHPNKDNINIIWSDIFRCHFDSFVKPNKTSLYLYISPWITEQIGTLISDIQDHLHIVSYKYPLEKFKEIKKLKGNNPIYIYQMPNSAK